MNVGHGTFLRVKLPAGYPTLEAPMVPWSGQWGDGIGVSIYIYITHIQMHGIYTHCGHMCFNAEVQVECPHGTAPNVQQDLEDCENLRVCR